MRSHDRKICFCLSRMHTFLLFGSFFNIGVFSTLLFVYDFQMPSQIGCVLFLIAGVVNIIYILKREAVVG